MTQVRRNGEKVRIYRGVREVQTADCHALSRETNHCTRDKDKESKEHNALARVTMRDTPASSTCDGDDPAHSDFSDSDGEVKL